MKNRNHFNLIKTLAFSIFMLVLSVIMNTDVFAETIVIDENSTYVDIDGEERKHLTIKKNKWIGFQGGAYLRHTYGEDTNVKIVIPSGVVSMGCVSKTLADCDYAYKDADEKFDFCLPIEIVLPKTCKTINHMDILDYYEDWTDYAYSAYNPQISYLEEINLDYVQCVNEEAFREAAIGTRSDGVLDLSKTAINKIGYYSFAENDALKKVIIGNKIKNIEDESFSSCANLSHVVIKYGVKSIGAGTFGKSHKTINCIDPTPDYRITVEIPSSVKEIGDSAFLSDYGNTEHILIPNPKAKIITPKNSYAHKWAKKNDIKVQVFNVKKPSNVSKLRAKEQTQTSVKLTYKAGANAEVYEIYQLKSGSYKKIATTSNLSYTVKKLKAGTVYKFKVVSVNETKTSAGKVISTATQPKKAVIKKISVKNRKVTLSWKKVKGATGYEIYRSTDGKTFELVKDTAKLTYTSKRMKKGNYIYKVRAYIKVGKNKIYGADSKVKKIDIQ